MTIHHCLLIWSRRTGTSILKNCISLCKFPDHSFNIKFCAAQEATHWCIAIMILRIMHMNFEGVNSGRPLWWPIQACAVPWPACNRASSLQHSWLWPVGRP